MSEAWLRLGEAIALICSSTGIAEPAANAEINRALGSGQLRCAYTAQAVALKERAAHSTSESAARADAHSRGLRFSGSAQDVFRASAGQEATRRAALRQAMIPDVASEEFKVDLGLGYIRINEKDLVDWRDRHLPAQPVKPVKVASGRRYVLDEVLVAEAVAEIRAETGTWANANQAAEALAGRAQGSSREAIIDRLGRKIRNALGD